MKHTSEYYPPITIKDMPNIFDMSLSDCIELSINGSLKTKKIGRDIYVSNTSLATYKNNIIKSKKDRVRKIAKSIIKESYEDKVLYYANLITKNRTSAEKNRKRLIAMKHLEYYSNNLSDLSYESSIEIDYDFKMTFSELKECIKEARNRNIFGFKELDKKYIID